MAILIPHSILLTVNCKRKKRKPRKCWKRCCCCCCHKKDKKKTDNYRQYNDLGPLQEPIIPKTDKDKEDKIRQGKLVKNDHDPNYDSADDFKALDDLDKPEGAVEDRDRNVSNKVDQRQLRQYRHQEIVIADEVQKIKEMENARPRSRPSRPRRPIKKVPKRRPASSKDPSHKSEKESARQRVVPIIDEQVYNDKAMNIKQNNIVANPRDPNYDTVMYQTLPELLPDR